MNDRTKKVRQFISDCFCTQGCTDYCRATACALAIAKKPIVASEGVHKVYCFTAQEMIDLRALITIAAWIRSEQLAQAGKIIQMGEGPDKLEIDTRDLRKKKCAYELKACQEWWHKLTDLGELTPDMEPSWQHGVASSPANLT